MALILSIETATKVCSVALHNGRELLALKELYIDRSHSELLGVLIRDMVKDCGYKPEDLDAIAVSKGPGSYTGLRIGTAMAKSLSFSLDIPLIGVNTLKAMAADAARFNGEDHFLCPMIDARRMEVYCIVMKNNGEVVRDTAAVIVDDQAFAELFKLNKILFFGNGSEKCKPLLGEKNEALFADRVEPSARYIGWLAYEKYKNRLFEDVAYFEPFYLKDFMTKKPKPRL